MNYPMSANTSAVNPRQTSVNEELITAAIVGVIDVARSKGQSLDDLIAEVLADDALLDSKQRRWLGEIVAAAWASLV